MTDAENAPGHDRPLCGATTRAGGSCRRPAGWGTPWPLVPGVRCKLHLGCSPNHQPAAERAAAEQVAARFGLDLDDTPAGEIILREIRRSSAMVCQLAAEVAALTPEQRTWGVSRRKIRHDAEGAEVVEVEQRAAENISVIALRHERKELRELIVAAHAARIEERYVALAEREGSELVRLLDRVLAGFRAAFGLDAGQYEAGRAVVAQVLRAELEAT